MRLPNQLTWLRIACIPVVVILLLEGAPVLPGADAKFEIQNVDILAAIVFGLAALTDFFDGWLARRFGAQSLLGKLLDPLADKLLVVASMIILVEKHKIEVIPLKQNTWRAWLQEKDLLFQKKFNRVY